MKPTLNVCFGAPLLADAANSAAKTSNASIAPTAATFRIVHLLVGGENGPIIWRPDAHLQAAPPGRPDARAAGSPQGPDPTTKESAVQFEQIGVDPDRSEPYRL
jgi:hypothetical protein